LKEDYKMKRSMGCLPIIIILGINAVVGTWSVVEILSWLDKSIPLLGSFVIGLFIGEFSIPVAIIGKILKACGVF